MVRVEYKRWGQSLDDLRRLALEAEHPRTRERFFLLYEIARAQQGATKAAHQAKRHAQTVLAWVHLYNQKGPSALSFQRTGGRPPFLQSSNEP